MIIKVDHSGGGGGVDFVQLILLSIEGVQYILRGLPKTDNYAYFWFYS